MRNRDVVTVYGRIRSFTYAAILFHVSLEPEAEVPAELRGQQLWFPRASCVAFRAKDGRQALDVPRRLLEDRVTQVA